MAQLLTQQTAIEQRIAKLRQTTVTLAELAEEAERDDDEQVCVPSERQRAGAAAVAGMTLGLMGRNMALSDAVREVLKASGNPLTSVQVRDGLLRMGIDLNRKYTSPLAVIHKALKRLHEKGEVKTGSSSDGKATYKWGTQNPRWLKHLKETGAALKNPPYVTLPDPPTLEDAKTKRYQVKPRELPKKKD